jgi:hypothetical protein
VIILRVLWLARPTRFHDLGTLARGYIPPRGVDAEGRDELGPGAAERRLLPHYAVMAWWRLDSIHGH